MARPRKYVQVSGKTIDGVHLHRGSGRYYIIDRRGKQVYYRDLQAASDAYRREQSDPVAVAKENAEYALRHAAMRQPEFFARLAEMFRSEEGAQVQLECSDPENRIRSAEGAYARDGQSIAPFADACGAPHFRVVEVGSDTLDPVISSTINPTLKRVGEAWLQAKLVEAGLSDNEGATRHIETTMRLWKLFVRRVGNVRVGELRPEHFRKFHEWSDLQSTKKPSAHWQKRLFVAVKGVFNFVQQRYPEWAWNAGIGDRLRALKARPHEPGEENAEPMSPPVFRDLIAQCDVWASTGVERIEPSTQTGKALRLQAQRKCREGRQLRTVLMLACNCGLNAVDIERLEWKDLHLSNEVPYLESPRTKVVRTAGRAISRRTPLLPQVVGQLRLWRGLESSANGRVFQTAQSAPVTKNTVGRSVGRLLDELGLDRTFTFRHLRNCGPTLAANAGLPEEMIERFLGHKQAKVSNRYKGIKPVDYLLPIIDLIEKEYFAELQGIGSD